ncbi:MAG: 50S ribosomal protein L13 [Candidatus Nealsonbacteria bacterium RIFCSPLOWO2_12_FULL_39_31]|uniref:Large ribosomal subunit protein uL13 n=3 Tax=Candidatus Nealsoniibacteriota TaxID=1817911 RepID=A0A1G2EFK4_9BACT|nr:MAG: Ribosomal protein L13 [Parcubacteria group bacterium GW2011_GWA2_38_27]KKQ98063.1 MAG: Ribosomal protein L13 [Parcubacteria group bacterium GW2011_GWC2_39_11]OGZ19444.1 MAG: 50S ribosomal protein L13 [Candidatus Nealsonbacteria bacterium RIFCSPHIGHO2_01_FULL_38_55]OGZ21177.1 MAG: 50S ribosomal protein L13 [Candidatus Nealsonbacteria bacterium RIFCSPHIGHO2_02_38_10]OGZ21473.1 MAG: 50S ribosomal protein L13 [Candidatus Nealsonbacteria bacterium RIFCSPHIGHO2_02_FULL_38_75]OGZ22612.1 MAG: 
MEQQTHTIDATGKILGRLASQIAVLLRGKNKSGFVLNEDSGDFVIIKNADKIKVSGGKYTKKFYWSHSGYLGSGKETPFNKIFEKNPGRVLIKAVYGMLPGTKLRAGQIKRLKFE